MEGGGATSSSHKRVALVTGANRGIGLEVCRQLASGGATVVLTARDEKRGAVAVDALRELGLPDVVFHKLDVGEPSSAARLADFVRDRFGRLDVLVNNAGVSGVRMDIGDPAALHQVRTSMSAVERLEWFNQRTTEPFEEAEECLRTNYHGTKNVTEALLPLLLSSSDARVVNVSSSYGLLRFFSGEDLKHELNDIDNLSTERLDELSGLFLKDFKNGRLDHHGWPAGGFSAYKVSKALINAYTRVLAKKHTSMRVNCLDPGYVKTDINFHTGVLTVEEGARGPVMLARVPKDGPTGAYFNGTEQASFV
ncbi:(+)-neomenthol dehydrogenase-like [Triticum dicoccoides]|uniref:(+)-neomenthol dehydrogenase-like n=1 Tax=Triticum dicoccoides TaxID=85692 RepID=UPI000E7C4FED|nr:(+)-neomenthol dehydrogenase-like [Triticum dicoccoides]